MAEMNNRVKIVEICKIPPSPNPASDFSLPLTSFDLLTFKDDTINRLFCYSITPTHNSSMFHDSIIPKLKHSLSLTLQHFLPLAGNLTFTFQQSKPKPIILYTPGDAVSLTVAEADADFNHISSHLPREIRASHSLLPDIQASDTVVPVMAIQVTKFPDNSGFSIGTTLNHAVVDSKTETTFLKAWAFYCKLDQPQPVPLPQELTPLFDRNATLNLNFFPEFDQNSLKAPNRYSFVSNWIRAIFELTASDITKLKKRALKNMHSHLSTFVVMYAYALVCLLKTRKAVGAEEEEEMFLVITADMRGRTDPPIPTNYFGNCVGSSGFFVEASEVLKDEDGFVKIAHRIGDEILKINKEKNLEFAMKKVMSKYDEFFASGYKYISVASSQRFKIYEMDFGWGKPKSTEYVLLEPGVFSVADAKDGSEGVEIGIVLPPDQIHVFASLFSTGLKQL